MTQMLDLLDALVAKAKAAGADQVEAMAVESVSVSVGVRLGALERLNRSEGTDIGLRVLVGKRQAIVSSADHSQAALDELVERAVAMARIVPEDPYVGLADPSELATDFPDLETSQEYSVTPEQMLDMIQRAEDAARAVPGITNSDGASMGWGRSTGFIVGSNGFSHSATSSSVSLSASVVAGDVSSGMEGDYAYTNAIFFEDLRQPEDVGREAGERSVKRLGARKVKTCQVPVVLDPRVGRGLIGSLSGFINGTGVARGTTFLKDKLGKPIFKPGINVVDDPLRKRGLRSRPCDSEGVATRRMNVVEDGVLTTWLLDCGSARQLGLKSTGHSHRGTGSVSGPGASNFYLEAGAVTAAELIGDIKSGLYVIELFGQGVNGITGDYSRGATGFWIENGEIAYPVAGITVAGNMRDMFMNLTPANDLTLDHGIDCPTIRIDGMTLAGA